MWGRIGESTAAGEVELFIMHANFAKNLTIKIHAVILGSLRARAQQKCGVYREYPQPSSEGALRSPCKVIQVVKAIDLRCLVAWHRLQGCLVLLSLVLNTLSQLVFFLDLTLFLFRHRSFPRIFPGFS